MEVMFVLYIFYKPVAIWCVLYPTCSTSISSCFSTVVSLQMIDGEAFLLLTQTDIVKIMSIKLGPALKISNAILMFKSTDEGLKWSPSHSPGSPAHQSSCAKFILLQGKDPEPFFMCSVSCSHQRGGGEGGWWGLVRVNEKRWREVGLFLWV